MAGVPAEDSAGADDDSGGDAGSGAVDVVDVVDAVDVVESVDAVDPVGGPARVVSGDYRQQMPALPGLNWSWVTAGRGW